MIDPFSGVEDLEQKTLRHVSDAFAEDPLRVFRVARFAAVLPSFTVAEDTRALMAGMAAEGALEELSAERVWAELVKAVAGEAPERFVAVLRSVGALEPWLPEFLDLAPVRPDPSLGAAGAFAVFVSTLSSAAIESLTQRLKAPKAHQRLALWIVRNRQSWTDWRQADPDSLMTALAEMQAFKPDNGLAEALEAAATLGAVDVSGLVQAVNSAVGQVSVTRFQAEGLKGPALGKALTDARRAHLVAAQSAS